MPVVSVLFVLLVAGAIVLLVTFGTPSPAMSWMYLLAAVAAGSYVIGAQAARARSWILAIASMLVLPAFAVACVHARFVSQSVTSGLGPIDTVLLYLVVPGAGMFVGFLGWGLTQENLIAGTQVRQVDGLCIACGYDLRSITDSRCPECGTPVHRQR